MGDWSDYFEDFPEENPANYDENDRYDPTSNHLKEKLSQDIANKKLDEILRKKGIPIRRKVNK